MGQCASRKATSAFIHSTSTTKTKSAMPKHKQFKSPEDEEKKTTVQRKNVYTKGVAMSFGFRRRPSTAPATADNAIAAQRLARHDVYIDRNGNGNDMECLTKNAVPIGRTTPKLVPPRKEANATRVSRFGFRAPPATRANRVADVNTLEYRNNNRPTKPKISPVDANENRDENRENRFTSVREVSRYTFLPKPQMPTRVMESKAAKTIANNCKRNEGRPLCDEASSKEGSVTEDSGVGSHSSAGNGETDTLRGVELLDNSPSYKRDCQKHRQLEMVFAGNNFDLRDLDDAEEDPVVPLPRLPSAFSNPFNTGFVRERRIEYERQMERTRRRISITSSEGFSDDYMELERPLREKGHNEISVAKSFLKPKTLPGLDSSNGSSDEHDWTHAGEAMVEDFSCSFSSNDDSKEKASLVNSRTSTQASSLIASLMNPAMVSSMPSNEIKSVLLTIEDPKFAAVACASNTTTLLEDETSPTDSLICSYSDTEENFRHKLMSKSDAKEIKVSVTPDSPGTPTNNSLSLSDGKDFFDDEIADQPALVFDDTLNPTIESQAISDNTPTLMDSTPKLKRRSLGVFESSPLLQRRKNILMQRTASVDTLSPCESIASDDLMMDFEQSQSSGLDDTFERSIRNSETQLTSDTTLVDEENRLVDPLPDLNGFSITSNKGSPKCNRIRVVMKTSSNKIRPENVAKISGSPSASRHIIPDVQEKRNVRIDVKTPQNHISGSMAHHNRLLASRSTTPSSIPGSPKTNGVASRSPMRPFRSSVTSLAGYESDDSIKLDRASHGAMLQDVVNMKTMLLKLKRVLNEQADEESLTRQNDTLTPFDTQTGHQNGLFNGLGSGDGEENGDINPLAEMAELRRQILFLQGQLEDREKTVEDLQGRMASLIASNDEAKSAPASTISQNGTTNAATQTERVRPASAGPSLLQVSGADGTMGSLVSVSETVRKSRQPSTAEASHHPCNGNGKIPIPKLWRKPGEPPSPQMSSIPRRANSRSRNSSLPT